MAIESLVTPGSLPLSVLAPSPALQGHGASPKVGPAGTASVAGVVVSAAADVADAVPGVDAVVVSAVDEAGAAVVVTVVLAAVVSAALSRSLPQALAMS